MLCNGNRQEECGGPNHLTLFQLDSLTTSSSTSSPSTSSSSTSSPLSASSRGATIPGRNYLGPNHLTLFQWDSLTTLSSTPSSSTSSSSTSSSLSTSSRGATIPGWNYLGCYTDSAQARSLSQSMAVTGGATNMTQENCQIACAQAGFILAGMEYSSECCNTPA
jgi:WSC domain